MDDYKAVVYELQDYLRTIARANPKIFLLVPDGIFGDETTLAVSQFQEIFNLPVTGKVDFETWVVIINEKDRILFELSLPIQVSPIDNSDLPLKKGDKNQHVAILQIMLIFVAEKFDNINKISATGLFDEPTEAAIKQWQGVSGLSQNGVVDKKTWNSLAAFYTM